MLGNTSHCWHQPLPVFQLLRCGLIISPLQDPLTVPNPMPEASIITSYIDKLKTRDDILRYMVSPGSRFRPGGTVILESDPGITTEPASPAGTVKILSKTTDTLELQADMDPPPGILLITNNYSTGWRVNPIKAAQPEYRIMPADYTLMGIPLQKGSHHIELEYAPSAFRIGMWITILSLVAFCDSHLHRTPSNSRKLRLNDSPSTARLLAQHEQNVILSVLAKDLGNR